MLAVMQLCKYATLTSGKVVSKIDKGVILLVGVHKDDTELDAKKLATKFTKTRIFKDASGKINLNILDIAGHALVVSNFTLQADTSHGNRPNFAQGAQKDKALALYELFVQELKRLGVVNVQTGVFGEHMDIDTELDGPITLVLDSHQLKTKV